MMKSINDARTTKRSKIFQPTNKYGFYPFKLVEINPNAIIFIKASAKKRKVNTISIN
jgi:hypothetical protein